MPTTPTKTDLLRDLSKRWVTFCSRFRLPYYTRTFDHVVAGYKEPHRHYHGLRHIHQLLSELEVYQIANPWWHGINNRDDWTLSLELALWLHDAVYEPAASDNEEKSARVALWILQDLERNDLGPRVERLIVATKHQKPPQDDTEKLVLDIDLSPIGGSWEDFVRDSRDIRLEYAHISDEDFRRGRLSFLESMLSRKSLFSLDYFRDKYEVRARENMARSAGLLASQHPL